LLLPFARGLKPRGRGRIWEMGFWALVPPGVEEPAGDLKSSLGSEVCLPNVVCI
jgi:hypothetical protein